MKRFFIFLTVLMMLAGTVNAAVGQLDTTFGTNGVAITDFGGNDNVSVILPGPSDTIIAIGTTSFDVNTDLALARYTSAGVLDTTFDTDGMAITDFTDVAALSVFDAAVQADGKIVVVGQSNNDYLIVRYNADGSIDTSFDTDGIRELDLAVQFGAAYTVAIQTDQKILVAGTADSKMVVARLNADGTLDDTFGGLGSANPSFLLGVNGAAYDMVLQDDGKIVLAGRTFETEDRFMLVRLITAGGNDTTFNTNGAVFADVVPGNFDIIESVAIDADGKIVVAGYTSTATQAQGVALARYDTTGTADATFGTGGIRVTSFGYRGASSGSAAKLVIDGDGKILTIGSDVGASTPLNVGLARFATNGTLDTTFDLDGILAGSGIPGAVEQGVDGYLNANGKLIVAGSGNDDFVVYRFETQGSTPAELLLNGGFEVEGTLVKVPAGWTGVNLVGDKRICNTDKFFSYTGNCAFRFKGTLDASIGMLSRPSDGSGLVAGDELFARFMVDGRSVIDNNADVMIKVKYASTVAKEVFKLPGGVYSYDVFRTDVLTITEPVLKLTIRLRYRGVSGKVYFDNVSLLYVAAPARGENWLPLPAPAQ